MTTARHSLPIGVMNNASGQPVIYAFGGQNPFDDGIPVEQVEAYNAATNTWTTKRRMPEALYQTNGVGLIGGKLYLPGGAVDVGADRPL